jgi:hypothetical protein
VTGFRAISAGHSGADHELFIRPIEMGAMYGISTSGPEERSADAWM